MRNAAAMTPPLSPSPIQHRVAASSGDVVLDRRREWALAATADGFHAGAAEIYEQILEQAPHWAIAWLELGDARRLAGDSAGARVAYEAAAERDPDGLLAAPLKLAAMGALKPPPAPAPGYVAGLFDQYAEKFDAHLVETLAYRGPQILRDAILPAAPGRTFECALDLGCGTGLMGEALADLCAVIDGVDLSSRMVEVARSRGIYRSLDVGDIAAWLKAQPAQGADLAVAADVFVYIGDLDEIFAAAAACLRSNGLFAFTVQTSNGAEFEVGEDMRYGHTRNYLLALAQRHGFSLCVIEDASTRLDAGKPVPGLVVVLKKP